MSDTKNPLLVEEPPTVAPEGTVAVATQRQDRRRRRVLPSTSPKFIVGASIVLAIVLFAVIAPFFTQDPRSTDNPALQPLFFAERLCQEVSKHLICHGRVLVLGYVCISHYYRPLPFSFRPAG